MNRKRTMNKKGRTIIGALILLLLAGLVVLTISLVSDISQNPSETEPTDAIPSGITEPSDTGEPSEVKPTNADPSEAEPTNAKPTEGGTEGTDDTYTGPTSSSKVTGTKKTSFYCLGDSLIHGYVYMYAQTCAGGSGYDFKPIYENIASDIKAADISFINQETPITGEGNPSGYPNFNSPKELAGDLAALGFDIVNIASNHMLDQGTAGLSKYIAVMKSYNQFMMIGGYENMEDAEKIRIVERNGVKFALLSFTYGTNGISLSSSSDIYVPYIDDSKIKHFVELAKKAGDVVVVSVHWGADSSQSVTSEQERVAKVFADCNVDVVIGHHSHTLLPVKWITRSDGKKMLCAYSLGNAVSRMLESYCIVGGALSFDVEVNNGDVKVSGVHMDPIITHYNNAKSIFRIYYFEDYSQALLDQHGYEKDKVSYDTMKKRIIKNIDSEFLSDFYK